MTTNASVAALAAQLVSDQTTRERMFSEWLNGTADGGPEGDGRYPIPSPSGTVLVPSFALLTDPLKGLEKLARDSAESAFTDASAADASRAAVEQLHTQINALLTEARTILALAGDRADDAAAEHAAARAEREACQALKADMQALYDEMQAT